MTASEQKRSKAAPSGAGAASHQDTMYEYLGDNLFFTPSNKPKKEISEPDNNDTVKQLELFFGTTPQAAPTFEDEIANRLLKNTTFTSAWQSAKFIFGSWFTSESELIDSLKQAIKEQLADYKLQRDYYNNSAIADRIIESSGPERKLFFEVLEESLKDSAQATYTNIDEQLGAYTTGNITLAAIEIQKQMREQKCRPSTACPGSSSSSSTQTTSLPSSTSAASSSSPTR